jgi:hypothetical protein
VLRGVIGGRPGTPTSPPSDDLLTIAPLPCLRICSSWYFMQKPFALSDNQNLAERVRVPVASCPWLKSDQTASRAP